MSINNFDKSNKKIKIYEFSVNLVPYPLDDYLRLKGEMTTDQAVEIINRWGRNE